MTHRIVLWIPDTVPWVAGSAVHVDPYRRALYGLGAGDGVEGVPWSSDDDVVTSFRKGVWSVGERWVRQEPLKLAPPLVFRRFLGLAYTGAFHGLAVAIRDPGDSDTVVLPDRLPRRCALVLPLPPGAVGWRRVSALADVDDQLPYPPAMCSDLLAPAPRFRGSVWLLPPGERGDGAVPEDLRTAVTVVRGAPDGDVLPPEWEALRTVPLQPDAVVLCWLSVPLRRDDFTACAAVHVVLTPVAFAASERELEQLYGNSEYPVREYAPFYDPWRECLRPAPQGGVSVVPTSVPPPPDLPECPVCATTTPRQAQLLCCRQWLCFQCLSRVSSCPMCRAEEPIAVAEDIRGSFVPYAPYRGPATAAVGRLEAVLRSILFNRQDGAVEVRRMPRDAAHWVYQP